MTECYRCGIERPDPEIAKDIDRMPEWEKKGEGWFVFASWDLHEKYYLCPMCARRVKGEIDKMRKIIRHLREKD